VLYRGWTWRGSSVDRERDLLYPALAPRASLPLFISPRNQPTRSQPTMDLAPTVDPFLEPRLRMVDSQVRPNRVTDPRILGAMRTLPRERFLPPDLTPLAYIDEDVPLGNGRVLMEPMATGRLIQLLEPAAGERALVMAAGVGYGAAVLAACGVRVTALEEDERLLALARVALTALAPAVSIAAGPLAAGWPSEAPYDLILLEGAVTAPPPTVVAQLRQEAGRLVMVLRTPGAPGQAALGEATQAGLQLRPAFDCSTPLIPSLVPPPTFAF
jgi:protein-L-isoaspartate(D-aspartate) O-methyltransferase